MTDASDPIEHFFAQPWSDGLPVVVPTEERLADMLGKHAPDALIGHVPPANHPATVEAVALHAVMAGCKPEYLPALLCALSCILDTRFNMNGIQATMNPAGPLIIMNGPYAREIGVHGGTGCLGPGFRANATIGRALRLMLLNLGGGVPGVVDMSTFGSPSKFAYCLRENEEISPWPSLAEERGFGKDENVVTACAGEGPRVALDDSSDHARRGAHHDCEHHLHHGHAPRLLARGRHGDHGARTRATLGGQGIQQRRREARATGARPSARGAAQARRTLPGKREKRMARMGGS